MTVDTDKSAGRTVPAGLGAATVLAAIDFETYSEAGYRWCDETNKWLGAEYSRIRGLPAVGAQKYSEHHSTDILCCAYDLQDGKGIRTWTPDQAPPIDLFLHVITGGLLEAWNCAFERWIWDNVCVTKYGFPKMALEQWRDAMAKARAHCLPASLDKCGEVLGIQNKKDKRGKALLNKFSKPRNPTKTDLRLRINPTPADGMQELLEYNKQDIRAQAEIALRVPDLTPFELEFWLCDQRINQRGVQLDIESIHNAVAIVREAHSKYNAEIAELTQGDVEQVTKVARMKKWIEKKGVKVDGLAEGDIDALLKKQLPEDVRRVLQIRQAMSSSAVKKLYAMLSYASESGRIHDIFVYHAARTGRAAGSKIQPQNFPNSGPVVFKCSHCDKHTGAPGRCGLCGEISLSPPREWNANAMEDAIDLLKHRSLEKIESVWRDPLSVISGCLRGMLIAKPEHVLIASDYSAIEAVVLAALAGEKWRLDVFKTHGMIYEMSASKITGIPFDDFINHKKKTGEHHPLRKKVGKVAELASGYQGYIGAWKKFGADEHMNDDEIKSAVLAWRKASPAIVEMWGGQRKNYREHYYGLEGAAINAVRHAGKVFNFREISYQVHNDVLYCKLPSGRYITYHKPRIAPSAMRAGTLELTFSGWNSNAMNGCVGWTRTSTYGGKLTENVVQAVARDLLAYAIVELEREGFKVVMHVHDEIVSEMPRAEVREDTLAKFERIMSTTPAWAQNWPIKAQGGWVGEKYRK